MADALSICLVTALKIYLFWPSNQRAIAGFGILLAGITITLIQSSGGYRRAKIAAFRRSFLATARCYIMSYLVLLAAAFFSGETGALGGAAMGLDLLGTPLLMAAGRLCAATRSRGQIANPCGAVIIHAGQYPPDPNHSIFAQDFKKENTGIFRLDGNQEPAPFGLQSIPDLPALIAFMKLHPVSDVIFFNGSPSDSKDPHLQAEILSALIPFPVRVWLAIEIEKEFPGILKTTLGRYKLVPIVSETLVSSVNPSKRLFDLVFACLILLIALPVITAIAVAVRLSGPGPVIFRQVRTGAHGRTFTVLKFRTMNTSAGAGFAQAKPGDPRVTRLGRLLRRTSLDESLQLINVIKGDMSLVGPRPHAPETEVEGVSFENAVKLYRIRHRVKPGMTGLAQIRGQRGETKRLEKLEQRIASDLEYIESWSLKLDLWILLRTVPVIFSQHNAY